MIEDGNGIGITCRKLKWLPSLPMAPIFNLKKFGPVWWRAFCAKIKRFDPFYKIDQLKPLMLMFGEEMIEIVNWAKSASFKIVVGSNVFK